MEKKDNGVVFEVQKYNIPQVRVILSLRCEFEEMDNWEEMLKEYYDNDDYLIIKVWLDKEGIIRKKILIGKEN